MSKKAREVVDDLFLNCHYASELWSLAFYSGLCLIKSLKCWYVRRGELLDGVLVLFGVQYPCVVCGWYGGSAIVEHLKI